MSCHYPQFEEPGDELRDEEFPDGNEPTMDEEDDFGVTCPKCGAAVFDDLDECPHCGTPLAVRRFGAPGAFWAIVSLIVLIAFVVAFVF